VGPKLEMKIAPSGKGLSLGGREGGKENKSIGVLHRKKKEGKGRGE